jgi:DNA-binding MarR family transcriptional regulator
MMLAELRRELEAPRPSPRSVRDAHEGGVRGAKPTKNGRTVRSAPEMTLARFDLLANLRRDDGQTLAALSRALLVTAGNVTGLVDRAERDGMVERRADPDDGRVGRVWLTRRGVSLIDALLPHHANQIHELLGELSSDDRKALRRILGSLRDRLPDRTSGANHAVRSVIGAPRREPEDERPLARARARVSKPKSTMPKRVTSERARIRP